MNFNSGLIALISVMLATSAAGGSLEHEFANPPVGSRPGAFWCWLNGNMTPEQITRDLEEMKAKGMGGAEIWDVQALRNPDDFIPAGPPFLGDESLDLIAHAIREAGRLDLYLGIIASSGWNAGGSWVPPEHAGKGLFWSETRVTGPGKTELRLPFPECPKAPKGDDGLPLHYREIAVLALPAAKTLKRIDDVIDVTESMDRDGTLRWEAPAGEWTILRVICTNHGQSLIVPSPNSGGPMIDFIDPAATGFHLRYIADRILTKLGKRDFRDTAFQYMEFDSMELAEGVLWSDGFAQDFERLRGYDPTPWLPLLAGWKFEDAETDQRFHLDYKLAVSDQLIHSHYVTGSKILADYGLHLVAEAGGPGPPIWDSCPVDAIKALGAVDVPRGEFWMGNPKHIFLIKEIASAAHVYGRPIVDAESFTTWRRWIDGPVTHKQLADRALCEGLNHFTLHTLASSPPEAGLPGRAYHAGTDINPTATWWPMSRPFFDYLARSSHMLRQGLHVADVCYFYGGQAPNFFPAECYVPEKPVLPGLGTGYDFDVIDANALITRLSARDGRLVLPDGKSYALLALPEQKRMPVEVLRKLKQLTGEGATILGPRPERSFGAKPTVEEEAEFQALVGELWGNNKIRHDVTPREALAAMAIGPDFHVVDEAQRGDFDYIHRSTEDLEIYFVYNKTMEPRTLDAVFRVSGRKARLWDPVSGRIEQRGSFRVAESGTRGIFDLPPAGSMFVVFGNDPVATHAETFDPIEPIAVDGPWTLRFPDGWGVDPAPMVIDTLECWTRSETIAVKHFSGIASYETTLKIPQDITKTGQPLWLDLGDLRETARVTLNGRDLGIVWTPPYRVRIDGALQLGDNSLKVEVANLWANRLIGDLKHPDRGTYTRTNVISVFKPDNPLLPSGLFGPVRITGE
ncbi:MAG TPA: glycosyl hydrolase [Luteolibacter sp.]|nr:glycosyl hydrolase [Luteolibacter sp.]